MAARAKAKPPAERARDISGLHVAVTAEDVREAARASNALLDLAMEDAAGLESAGIDGATLEALEGVERDLKRYVKIPSATSTALAALGQHLKHDEILTLYHRTVQAMHAMAPYVLLKLAQKLDDDQTPGSTRVLLEFAKGIGLFTTAEPISTKTRLEALDEKSIRKLSDEELSQKVFDL